MQTWMIRMMHIIVRVTFVFSLRNFHSIPRVQAFFFFLFVYRVIVAVAVVSHHSMHDSNRMPRTSFRLIDSFRMGLLTEI